MLSSFRPPANASDGSSTATTPSARRARTTIGWPRLILRRDTRFKGIAIVPMHDADAALEELRHAYTELGMCGVLFPGDGSALEPWSKTVLAGVCGSGALGLSGRRSRRWPLGPRYGDDEYLHRRQCHWTSHVSGDRFGGDGAEQSLRPFHGPARSLSGRRAALVSHGARTSVAILRGGHADQSARRITEIAGRENRRGLHPRAGASWPTGRGHRGR